jgi:hypothetical protein
LRARRIRAPSVPPASKGVEGVCGALPFPLAHPEPSLLPLRLLGRLGPFPLSRSESVCDSGAVTWVHREGCSKSGQAFAISEVLAFSEFSSRDLRAESLAETLSGREAEDECKRSVGARPVLADEWLPAPAEEAAEDERDDHDVVKLTGNRDEVRD